MVPAMSDFIGGRVAIASGQIARITSDQIGDENPFQPCALDHSAQQLPRTIATERNSGAIASQAARRYPNKNHFGRHAAVARYYP
jgi:hypothetical protein